MEFGLYNLPDNQDDDLAEMEIVIYFALDYRRHYIHSIDSGFFKAGQD